MHTDQLSKNTIILRFHTILSCWTGKHQDESIPGGFSKLFRVFDIFNTFKLIQGANFSALFGFCESFIFLTYRSVTMWPRGPISAFLDIVISLPLIEPFFIAKLNLLFKIKFVFKRSLPHFCVPLRT